MKRGKRFLSMLLCAVMILTVLPTTAFAEGETTTPKNIQLGAAGVTTADKIYFGNYNSAPVQWRVLDTKTNTGASGLFLLSEDLQATGKSFNQNNDDGVSNNWQGSWAQAWCQDFATGESTSAFTATEQTALLATTKSDSGYDLGGGHVFAGAANILNGDKVFFLSVEETANTSYGFIDNASRIANYNGTASDWWLRSADAYEFYKAGAINEMGELEFNFNGVDGSFATRPAFNLDTSKVLFTSPAVDGKVSGTVGAGALNPVDDKAANANLKLTLLDSTAPVSMGSVDAKTLSKEAGYSDWSIAIDFSTAFGNAISAMLCDESGNVLYYGNLKEIGGYTTDAYTGDVNIPANLAVGNYTLKIFAEQLNGDNKTDYATPMSDIALTVTAPVPTVETVTVSPATANVTKGGTQAFTVSVTGTNNPAQTVTWAVSRNTSADTKFNGATLTVGNDEKSTKLTITATSTVDTSKFGTATVTIPLSAAPVIQLDTNNIVEGNTVYFGKYTENATTYDVPWIVLPSTTLSQSSVAEGTNALPLFSKYTLGNTIFREDNGSYSGSFLQTAINTIYGNFSSIEQNAVAETTLAKSSLYPGQDDLTAQRLFPLSYAEAENLGIPSDILIAKPITNQTGDASNWWNRSSDGGGAYYIGFAGYADRANVTENNYTARPAFNMDTNSVLFASSTSGKSATGMDTALKSVPTAITAEWKLTLKDTNRSTFTAESISKTNNTLKVKYTAAQTGTNEYISAVVKAADNTIKYYGRIAQVTSATGTVDIDLTGITMAEGDTLCVFNEQYNGDNKTDYASELKTVSVTAPSTELPAAGLDIANGQIVITKYDDTLNTIEQGNDSLNRVKYRIANTAEIKIYGSTENAGSDQIHGEAILVKANTTANITLAGLTIITDYTHCSSSNVFLLQDGTKLNLTIADGTTNTLSPDSNVIESIGTSELTINGNNGVLKLKSKLPYTGFDIDGEKGSVTINGGIINLESSMIGIRVNELIINGGVISKDLTDASNGVGFDVKNITINGGTVNITSETNSTRGILVDDKIIINGGSVNTVGIMKNYSDSLTPVNNAGAPVYLTTITLDGITAKTAITALTSAANYGIKDMQTDASGKLYLYLPVDTKTTSAAANGKTYTGSVTTTNDDAAAGTLKVPTQYTVTKGQNSEWTKGGTVGLTFTVDADYSKFTTGGSVLVDGTVITSDKYTSQSGSTVITLKAAYLETLSVDTHTLRVNFADGYAETSFTIKAASTETGGSGDNGGTNNEQIPNTGIPATGDNSHMLLWGLLMLLSAGGIKAIGITQKKRKSNSEQ